jgi:uncharacterized protein (TIGR03435 family)
MKELVVFIASALAVSAQALSAQTPAFEVASIKPNRAAGGMSSMHNTPGRITMENVSLKKLILAANGIPDDRDYALSGPDWLATEHFDIQATYAAGAATAQVQQMIQTLLAQRFHLVLHRESRQMPMYALVIGKNGPKIHAVEDGQGRTSAGPGRLEATKVTIQKLADLLGRLTGQRVTDATGLKGVYDFTLEWTPDDTQKATPSDDAAPVGGASLFAALQEQLGLKLEGRKGPVEILVVDHMEKVPTEN